MDWVLHTGDALRVVPELGPVDAVITDPPYSSGGTFRGDRTLGTVDKYQLTNARTKRAPFSGDTRDQRAFGYWCTLWLNDCYHKLKPGGVACVFTDWRQLPILADSFQAAGFVWRGVAVWDKTEAAKPERGRLKQQTEYVVWGSKGAMGRGVGLECHAGVYREQSRGDRKFHLAGKPVGLMRWLVRLCPKGGWVLDPFMGSGTTGVAALAEGRKFIGIELDPSAYAIAEARLKGELTVPADLKQGTASLLGA